MQGAVCAQQNAVRRRHHLAPGERNYPFLAIILSRLRCYGLGDACDHAFGSLAVVPLKGMIDRPVHLPNGGELGERLWRINRGSSLPLLLKPSDGFVDAAVKTNVG